MRKSKKRLLGLLGLLAIGVLTVVASGIPGASAFETTVPPAQEGVNLQVVVSNPFTSIRIAKPDDGMITVGASVPVEVYYSQTNRLEIYLTKESKARDAEPPIPLVDDSALVSEAGVYHYNINTASLDLDAVYQVHAKAYGNNQVVADDTTAFDYRAITANDVTSHETNGDPILDLFMNQKVKQVSIQVYNGANQPLFVANGKDVPLVISDSKVINVATGKAVVALPFAKYNAASGEYTITITAYADNGDIISMYTPENKLRYNNPSAPIYPDEPDQPGSDVPTKPGANKPNTGKPDVPNTGVLNIGGLNITRLDYLLTGLIAFGVAAGFALYLVFRKKFRH